jgi:prepilin-type N-terminal cleavage/methylation domain-containing protein/prepilin-type processing-associated H-X9-DG protein
MNTFSGQRSYQRSDDSAFTLVELLTVIAIIGILAGILIPVVGKMRESARRSECASQLRGIHQAIGLYMGEKKNFYPPAYGGVIDTSLTWWWYKGDSPLAAYAGDGGAGRRAWIDYTICVTSRTTANVEPPGVPGYPYVVNYNVMPNYNAQVAFKAIHASALHRPSATILMADSGREGVWTGPGFSSIMAAANNWNRVAELHGERTNILWCDGHVTSVRKSEITIENCQL